MKTTNKKYFKFILTIIIFFSGSLLRMIPAYIFNISENNITPYQSILLTLFSNSIVTIIFIILHLDDLKKDVKEFKNNYSIIIDKAFQIWVIGLIFMAGFNILINYFSPNKIANNEEAIRNMISINPYIMLINTALFAPVIEEITFRKSFRDVFGNTIIFIIISGIVFGSLHVITSVQSVFDYLYLLPYCSLGIAFSYMYYKTNNIFAPIFMHFIHNLIITIMNILFLGMIIC